MTTTLEKRVEGLEKIKGARPWMSLFRQGDVYWKTTTTGDYRAAFDPDYPGNICLSQADVDALETEYELLIIHWVSEAENDTGKES